MVSGFLVSSIKHLYPRNNKFNVSVTTCVVSDAYKNQDSKFSCKLPVWCYNSRIRGLLKYLTKWNLNRYPCCIFYALLTNCTLYTWEIRMEQSWIFSSKAQYWFSISNNLPLLIHESHFSMYLSHSPNVVVEWSALLLRVREVPGSSLGPKTSYPDWGFLWFSSISPGKLQDRTLN
jgi:hypothetical protein